MPEQLTILGASVRAAAQSAVRAGLAVAAMDLFADRDLAALCPTTRIRRYPAEFLQALTAAPQAPWMYTGGLENHPRLIERLAGLRRLLGNGGRGLVRVRDPVELSLAATKAGCRFPNWLPQPTGEQLETTCNQGWLLKPRRSSGGQTIRWVTSQHLGSVPASMYCQQHIAGQSASAVFVAARRQAVLLGATRQLIGADFGLARPFAYAGSIGPLPLAAAESDRLKLLGDVLAERFDLVGLFNVDFIHSADGLWVLEVNPRYSASVEVLERLTGQHYVAHHVAACRKNVLPKVTEPSGSSCAGKAVVYAEETCRVPPEFDELPKCWPRDNDWPAIADLPQIGQTFRAGEPIATAFAFGTTESEVEVRLRQRVAEVLAAMDPPDNRVQ